MYTKVCVLLLALGLSQAVPKTHLPDVGLMSFMMQSRDLSQNNPARSLGCFDYYLPVLNDVAETYKAEYAQCLNVADESRQKIDDNTQDDRDEINGSATDACKALQLCSQKEDSIDYFSCYTNSGSDNTKVMYSISANSAEFLAQVRELYRNIETEEYLCCNKTERTYVESTSNTYEQLNNCLSGKSPVPSDTTPPAPTTLVTEPTTAKTDEQTESTAAPDTTAKTDEPTESTAAPDTTAKTDEPTAAPTESTAAPDTTEKIDEPTFPTTEATTEDNSQKENYPEEDLSRAALEQTKLKSMMEDIKQWLKRH